MKIEEPSHTLARGREKAETYNKSKLAVDVPVGRAELNKHGKCTDRKVIEHRQSQTFSLVSLHRYT